MKGLNDFEQSVLDKLLAGDHPILAMLRSQAEQGRLTGREYTGVGFFCDIEVPPTAPTLTMRTAFQLLDVEATMDGLEHGAGFVLFIREGCLSLLEGFTYDEVWPREVNNVALTYRCEPRELPFS